MKWDDVDLKKGEWIIPASETKNGAEHLVPLSDTAVALLSSVPRPAEPKGPHIFTTTDGEIPINGFTVAKRRLDRASGITGWRVHDIRRTVRTRLAKIKIPDSIAERVLNHLPGGIVRVYNIHDYAEEKREALDLWAAHLRDIVAPSPKNIIEMKKKIPV
jgi:integrase